MTVDTRCPSCNVEMGESIHVIAESADAEKTCDNCGCLGVLVKTDPEDGYGDDYYYYDYPED